VLIVDDDRELRELMAWKLRREGYDVRVAGDGAEALGLIETEPPAVILLDLQMPVLDGLGFARELRRRRISLPIVLMSGSTDGARAAAEIGAEDWLPKPFEWADLLACTEHLCKPSTAAA
jgi:DNA-binding response OmpR family regulator